ncbi:SRPBCC family protein [Williamsia sp.]|uniref:SRPBCC family protein n=1 Tax=Williamsia sp. TaxID=1872085 RepID=UPI002F957009
MVNVQRTFTVDAPVDKVRAYLRDFANAEQWDPGTRKCTQVGTGPVVLGTEWDNTSKIAGIKTQLRYKLTRDDPDRVTLEGVNKTATSIDDISIHPQGPAKTTVAYHAHVVFNGVAKLSDPVFGLVFKRLADETQKQMTETLGAL